MNDVRPAPAPTLPAPWFTEARQALLLQARAFAHDEVLPLANELDRLRADIPESFLDRMAELGYFGILVGPEHGGLGLGAFEYCMVSEELARGWMSVASIIARAQGMATGIGSPDKQRSLLERSARGRWICAVGLSEPESGSDLASVATTAELVDGQWEISGRKRWTGLAKAADCIQVLCRVRPTEPGESRSAGLGMIVVEKERGEFPAGITGTPIDKVGYHGFTTWELSLDRVRVPHENLLGLAQLAVAGEGTTTFRAVQSGLNLARVHTAARAVGLARAAVEDSTLYLQERRQFDRPIGDFQALRFRLATMAAKVEQARAFYRQVAALVDAGVPCDREAAMVKLVTTEMAVEVTNDAMQLHGGNGYTTERSVERYWRDARLTTIFEGTSEIQQRIISERLLGKVER